MNVNAVKHQAKLLEWKESKRQREGKTEGEQRTVLLPQKIRYSFYNNPEH